MRIFYAPKCLIALFLTCSFLLLTTLVTGQTKAQLAEMETRQTQATQYWQKNFCHTMQIPENRMPSENINIEERLRQFERVNNRSHSRNSPTWNVKDGYGSGCTHDCVSPMPSSCGTSSELFRVPIQYTLNTTSGCTTASGDAIDIPTQAQLDAQINIMNDYFACESIPIEFYQCAPTRVIDVGCGYDDALVTNVPDVVNIYVFAETGNGTGCNGFAFLPSNSNSPNTAVMSHNCYNSYTYTPLDTSVPANCTAIASSLGSAQVLIHELGHYLGLYHTHESDINNDMAATADCDDPDIATDDCTTGDAIADTDEDPDFSGNEIGCEGCVHNNVPGCDFDDSTTACAKYGSAANPPNTINNIMGYNNFQGCRYTLTECQKTKMVDALLCVRGPQMCCRDVAAEFPDPSNGPALEICVNDGLPTFTASSACYVWYDALGSAANQIGTGMTLKMPI